MCDQSLRPAGAEHGRERSVTAAQHRPAVRDERPLDGKIEQWPQRVAQPLVVDSGREPRARAKTEAAFARTEHDIAERECQVLRQPEDDLVAPGCLQGFDAGRKRCTRPVRVVNGPRASGDCRAPATHGMHSRAVALDHASGASGVPEHGHEHMHGYARTMHVAIEGPPEALLLAGLLRQERVDEHDGVTSLDVQAPDVLAPLAVAGAPSPQTVVDPEDVHGR